jgi:CMP-N,N'-diacetyllegionaminic acid synthase
MEVLAIIPAKKISKGLLNKNIKKLDGHPLLAYSIAAGLKSSSINRVICTTNSKKIANIAIKYGAEVPFLRPDKYCRDNSSDIEFIKHCLDWLKTNENYKPDLIVQLRPTSPIRYTRHLNEAIKKIKINKNADSLRAVSSPITTPYKMWKIKNHFLNPLLNIHKNKEPYNTPRQKLPKVFAQTGYVDIIKYDTIFKMNSLTGNKILSYIVPEDTYVDVDDKLSFDIAQIYIKKFNSVRP